MNQNNEALISDLIRLIEKTRAESFWNGCDGHVLLATSQEHLANKIEEVLVAHGYKVPPSRYRGVSIYTCRIAHFHFAPRPQMSAV